MKNPYFINEPTAISFSGGRTSAFMLYKCLEAHDAQLPDEAVVTFANTGKEMPETLDFVQACTDNWGVDIVWLEARVRRGGEEENKYVYETVEVSHATASRKGEPFTQLIEAKVYAPNPLARFCTKELKVDRIKDYMRVYHDWWTSYIGIRADERRRAVKIHNKSDGSQDQYCPLYADGVTKEHVYDFWINQNFDLQLSNNNGISDWGNCDLCFLKGKSKRLSIIRERPDLASWWIEKEHWLKKHSSLPNGMNSGNFFRKDEPSYEDMKLIASNQGSLFRFDNDESIPCFCGD